MDTKPYAVVQGDYLEKIAFRFGTTVKEIWENPKNKELVARRKNPNILHPGDLLFVPAKPDRPLPLELNAENTYVAEVPEVSVQVKFIGEDGKPLAGKKYWVYGVADTPDQTGTTGGDGSATLTVKVTLREVSVVLEEDPVVRRLRIGDLNPCQETSGQRARLANLGYCPDEDRLIPAALVAGRVRKEICEAQLGLALQAFREAQGLDPDGEVDADTLKKLEDAFGN